MKQKLLLFAFTLLSTMLFSQAVPMAFEDWKTTLGTQNFFYKNIVRTSGTDTYMAGATKNANGDLDMLIAKYNSGGHLVWIQQYAGAANAMDFASDLQISGSYVYVTGAVTTNTTTLLTDYITMQLDKTSGAVQWTQTYDGAGASGDVAKAIYVDATTSSIWVTGASYNSTPNTDIVTIKYNLSGTQQFVKTFNSTANKDDAGVYIRNGAANQVVIAGVSQQTITTSYKSVVLTYSISTGTTISSTTGTVVSTNLANSITAFAMDASGTTVYLAGTRTGGGQGENFYVQKIILGSSGATVAWTYQYNNASNLDDIPRAVDVDASGNVYISGYTAHATQGKNIVLMKLNSSGVNQWTQTSSFSGDEEIGDLVLDASNNIYVTGYRKSEAFGDNNYYTAKYSNAGTKQWEIESDGNILNDVATNIALDSLNNVIVTGQTQTSPGVFAFTTVRYLQQDVITPTDFNLEAPSNNFMYFANKGQLINTNDSLVPDIKFYTSQTNPAFYFKNNRQSFVFAKNDTLTATPDTIHRIDLRFPNSYETAKTFAKDQKRDGYLNYYLAHTDTGGITGVLGNQRLITSNLYNNIDLMCSSNSKGIKYYFIVKPGGDMRDIKLEFTGASSYSLNGTTNALTINSPIGSLTFDQPVAYQLTSANATVAVTSFSPTWTVDGASNKYKFNNGSYTSSLTLVIQVDQGNPGTASSSASINNLDYSTYRGSSGYDVFNDIDVSADGSRVVVGYSTSGGFPTVNSIYPYSGFKDAVIVKYTPGDSILFSAFIGGSSNDMANSVAVNTAGEIFIGGFTSSNNMKMKSLTGASNQVQNGMVGNPGLGYYEDGFIAKYSANGLSHPFGRYYGGSRPDEIKGICLDASGNLHFAGYAFSTDIVMHNAMQSSVATWQTGNNCEAVFGKFNTSMQFVYDTYFGGVIAPGVTTITQDVANDITIDGSGNAIIVGWSDCIDLPIGNPNSYTNTFYQNRKGPSDGFMARVSPTGTKQFASYFGGNGRDEIKRVTYDPAKDVIYFAGQTSDSTAFPFVTKSGALNYRKPVTQSAFVAMMDGGLGKQWSSLYGKTGTYFVNGLSTDAAGLMYLSGYTTSSDSLNYPTIAPSASVYLDSVRSGTDGFVAIFSPWQTLFHAHYLGGTSADNINNSDIGLNQKYYVVGSTQSSVGFPIVYTSAIVNYIDSTHNGNDDGFITRFNISILEYVNVKNIEFNDETLIVFPNPSNTLFNINLSDDVKKNTQLSVYSVMGQLIYEKEITSKNNQVNCANWADGVYIIKISNLEGSKTFKVIKQ